MSLCANELLILGVPLGKSLQVEGTEGIKVLRSSGVQHPHGRAGSQNGGDTSELVMRTKIRPREGLQSRTKEAPARVSPALVALSPS